MNKTPIEWTDFTVNPFRFRNLATGKVGHHCAKISPGCKNCYSSTMQTGPYLSGLTFIEENKPKGEFFLDEAVLQQVLKRRKPARIFWCDMTDMFLGDYPDEWIDRCFAVMALTPHLTHQVLTKRARRVREYFAGEWLVERVDCFAMELIDERVDPNERRSDDIRATAQSLEDGPLTNVWLGVSVEDQQRKDRIALLQQTPSAIRFLSIEPLLEDIGTLDLRGISWVIVGGESGKGARPLDIDWVRSIIAQCKDAGVACFVKQLGAMAFSGHSLHKQIHHRSTDGNLYLHLDDRKGGDIQEWPIDIRVRQMPQAAVTA